MRSALTPLQRLALLIAPVVVWLVACHNYYQSGLDAMRGGNLVQAEEEAREGLEDDPSDPWLHLLMAEVLIAQERYAEARPYADTAVQRLPREPRPRIALGEAQIQLGNLPSGLLQWVTARRQAPELMSGYTDEMIKLLPQAITTALDGDKPEEAVFLIEGLRDLKPDHPDAGDAKLLKAREAYAQKLVRLARYPEAIDLYRVMYESAPNRPEFLLERGTLLMALGRDDEAKEVHEAFIATGKDAAARAVNMDAIADRAFVRNRPELAEAYWTQALETDPGLYKIYLQRAALRLQAQRPEEGYADLQAYVKATPQDPAAYRSAAEVALKNDHGHLAIELLQEGSQKATPDFGVAKMLAELLARRERRGDMEDVLERYIARTTDKAAAMIEVAEWFQRNKEYDPAAFYLNKAIKEGGDANPQLWYRLAWIQAQSGNPDEMEKALDQFVDKSGKRPEDYLTAANMFIERRYYDRAEELLQEGRGRHGKDADLARALAEVYDRAGEADREEKAWRDWIKTQPNPGPANLEVGERYGRRSDTDRAIPFLKEAARFKETAPGAWLAIGEAYQRRGMDKEMREAFEEYLKVSPDRSEALKTLLARYADPSRAEDAVRTLEVLIKLNPDDLELYVDLGRRYLLLDDTEKALEIFRTYATRSPNPVKAVRSVARLLRNQNRHAMALELYETLLALQDKDPSVLADVGELYLLSSRDPRVAPQKALPLEDAARGYFVRYIESIDKAKVPAEELTAFATMLVNQRLWALAGMVFEKIKSMGIAMNANDHYVYGEALLHLGQFEEARKAFDAHLGAVKNKQSRYYQVGRAAYNAEAFDLALRYLQPIMNEPVEASVDQAFELISRILMRTGRRDQIEPVANRLLQINRATWPVRQKVAATYAEAGLWSAAATEYRDLLRLQPDNVDVTRRLAEVVYRSGDRERAIELFSGAAKTSSDPATTWQVIASFYIDHGEIALAQDAFAKAEEAGGTGATVQLYRGVLAALTGEYDKAQEDFKASLGAIGAPDDRYQAAVEALALTPRLDLALMYAREGADQVKEPAPLLQFVAEQELERGEQARGMRNAAAWYQVSHDPLQYATMLRQRGYDLALLELFRSEVEVGDNIRTEVLVFETPENTAVLLEHFGADRLPNLYQPLLERRLDAGDLHRSIGRLYSRIADRNRAILHLSAAASREPSPTDLLLELLYADGDARKARSVFTRYIGQYSDRPGDFQDAVHQVMWAYVAENALTEAEGFVRGAMAHPDRETLLAPVLTELLLLQGRRQEALDLLRSGRFRPLFAPEDKERSPTSAARLNDLLQSARLLAGYGYGEEAARLLSDVVANNANEPALLLALIELGSRHGLDQVGTWATAFMGVSVQRGTEPEPHQLRLADAYLNGGDDARARDVLMKLVGVHQKDIARQALDRLASMAYMNGDTRVLDKALDAYLAGQADTFQAYLDEGQSLNRMGMFARAADRYGKALSMLPGNRAAITNLLRVRYLAGDAKQTLAAHAIQRQITTTGYPDEIAFGRTLSRGPDQALASAFWSRLHDTYPALSDATLGQARSAYLQDDAKGGRAAVDAYINTAGTDPLAIEPALEMLAETQQWRDLLDIARATQPPASSDTAPTTALPPRTPLSYLYIGAAHYAQGQRTEALAQFDAYTRFAPDPLSANLRVAQAIRAAPGKVPADANTLTDAVTYVERAIQQAPDSPDPYLIRGELRLGLGKVPDAVQDFNTWLDRGAWDQVDGLRRIGQALLTANRVNEAEPFLLRLARTPALEPGMNVAMALRAYKDAGAFTQGLRFLGAHFPAMATAPHLHVNLLLYTADLHAGAGHKDRAVTLYEQALDRYPLNPDLMNNLAYVLAQANTDLDRAEQLARRALGSGDDLSDLTQGTYLDTLAWIHFKQGKTNDAIAEQLQALRLTAASDNAKAVTLYNHLAEMYDKAGKADDAKRARTHARLHDADRAPVLPDTR